jgi:hypothetical protein
MAGPPIYKIHPSIGVARVGNAPASDYFIGPERLGAFEAESITPPKYTTAKGEIRRQAARFRVWRYVDNGAGYVPDVEITSATPGVLQIVWTVHLANRKGSFQEFRGLVGSKWWKDGSPGPLRNMWQGDAARLEFDPGPQTIWGESKGPIVVGRENAPAGRPWPKTVPDIASLGELRTDKLGRLIVVGGAGIAGSLKGVPLEKDETYNHDRWFDDVSDGPINVEIVTIVDGNFRRFSAVGAWLLVGPPRFAPAIPPFLDLYQTLLNISVLRLPLSKDDGSCRAGGPMSWYGELHEELFVPAGKEIKSKPLKKFKPSFDRDILPVLRSMTLVGAVVEQARDRHGAITGDADSAADIWKFWSDPSQPNDARRQIFAKIRPLLPKLRPKSLPKLSGRTMPAQLGDSYAREETYGFLSMPYAIYRMFERWAEGQFIGTTVDDPKRLFEPFISSGTLTPHELDEAQLRTVVGGGLHPGIETSWLIRYHEILAEPFRIRQGAASPYEYETGPTTVDAGFFTRQLAVPWQADFLSCGETTLASGDHAGETWWWWPSHRPDWISMKAGYGTTWTPDYATTDEYVLKTWHTAKFIVPKASGRQEEQ